MHNYHQVPTLLPRFKSAWWRLGDKRWREGMNVLALTAAVMILQFRSVPSFENSISAWRLPFKSPSDRVSLQARIDRCQRLRSPHVICIVAGVEGELTNYLQLVRRLESPYILVR